MTVMKRSGMTPRRPNRKAERDAPGVVVCFLPHEMRCLRMNLPGPSGRLGGYQREENWILLHTDPDSGRCELDQTHLERIIRYCQPHYGPGGPNGRMRDACIPALRRSGIDLLPKWRTP